MGYLMILGLAGKDLKKPRLWRSAKDKVMKGFESIKAEESRILKEGGVKTQLDSRSEKYERYYYKLSYKI